MAKATAKRAKPLQSYSPGWLKERQARFDALTHDPEGMKAVMARVADGDMLVAICREMDVSYQAMMEFIDGTQVLREAYERARTAAKDMREERILRTLEEIGDIDIADIYNDDGSLKPLKDMPEHARKAIASIETDELYVGRGKDRVKIGETRKVKLYDKLKAKELLGKRERIFGESGGGSGKGGVTVIVNREGAGQQGETGVKIEADGQTLALEE